MKRPRLPFEELTDPENQNVLATLSGRSWNLMNTNRVRAQMYRLGHLAEDMPEDQLPELPSPLEVLMDLGFRSSGSIGGRHRENITDAIKGATAPKMGLVAPIEGHEPEERGI